MKVEILETPQKDLIEYLDQKIDEFNWQNWEVKERRPIAAKVEDEDGEVIAGAAGRTFGDWFLLDTLWVSEKLRGQNIGGSLLEKIEAAARQRGCKKCLLDTLNFQAMPFYEKFGYTVQWVQEGYPKTGCKYFMVKDLRGERKS